MLHLFLFKLEHELIKNWTLMEKVEKKNQNIYLFIPQIYEHIKNLIGDDNSHAF